MILRVRYGAVGNTRISGCNILKDKHIRDMCMGPEINVPLWNRPGIKCLRDATFAKVIG